MASDCGKRVPWQARYTPVIHTGQLVALSLAASEQYGSITFVMTNKATTLRPGFTLIELMVVMGVIAALAGLSVAVMPMVSERSAANATQAVVAAVATAIAADGRSHFPFYDASLAASRLLPAWDVNGDGILDGDPTQGEFAAEPGILADVLPALPDYRGAVLGLTAVELPEARIGAQGRITDGWGEPLRIMHRGASEAPAGVGTTQHFLGIYSIGPDGVDQEGAGDDLRSW